MDIIILVALILIPAALVVIMITRLNRNQWRRVQEMQGKDTGFVKNIRHAMEATATVINKSEKIAPDAGGFAKVDLHLEIHLTGKSPYQVSTCWLVKVDSLDQVAPGMNIPVKVDSKKTERILPNVPWATPWIF